MPVTLITGPYQSGKSFRLWQRLRAEAPGRAVLVRPRVGYDAEDIRQLVSWGGAGLLPRTVSFAQLVEKVHAAAEQPLPPVLSQGLLTHLLRSYVSKQLRSTWKRLGEFRGTARELAELVLRIDAHGLDEASWQLAGRQLDKRDELRAHLLDAWDAYECARREATRCGYMLPGERMRRLTSEGALPEYAAIYVDDFQSFSPDEVQFIKGLGQGRDLIIAAVDDRRLGMGASLAERLRMAIPDANEERCVDIAASSPHVSDMRSVVTGLLDDSRTLPDTALSCYRYRDPIHAGRAIAAWLRRHRVAASDAMVVLRVADSEGLALADALRAADIPVRGRFSVPLLGTTVGGALAALARYCRQPQWGTLLALLERITHADPAPVPLSELVGPWSFLTIQDACAHWQTIVDKGHDSRWGWQELPHNNRAWLRATLSWIERWTTKLEADGTWWQRFCTLAARFDLSDGDANVVRTLHELVAAHPLSGDDLDEVLAAARVTVERDDGVDALGITDAVRGRTLPKRVVFVHDLEHGRWPSVPRGGALLPLDERRRLQAVLDRDIFDEVGRIGGETAGLLATIARATERVVFGIPGGERQPTAWLGTIAAQVGWDLEALRNDLAGEAVPGAPLGLHDAQGAHERALHSGVVGVPSFQFRVPPRKPDELGLRASGLGAVFLDSFAVVCDRLCLSPPLQDRERLEEGNDLHKVLGELAAIDPSSWQAVLHDLLAQWIAAGEDPLVRSERARFAQRVETVIKDEALVAATAARMDGEEKLPITLPIPDHANLVFNGIVDRIDHLPDGSVRLVDYKRGDITSQSRGLKRGIDGQLLAYLLAARAQNWTCTAAYYLALRTGRRDGWGEIPTPTGRSASKAGIELDHLDVQAEQLAQAIAHLAAGIAHADAEGRSASDYAPIARLDELRLVNDDEGGGDGY